VIESTVGPMSTTLAGIELAMVSVLKTEPWLQDPEVVEMPWKHIYLDDLRRSRPKLSIGVMAFDGHVHVHPPIERGMRIAVDLLRKAGHQVS
jgi:amidase